MHNIVSTGSANGEGAGKLAFNDQTVGSTRMLIDTNGNVGIGTSTPTEKLYVNRIIRVANDSSIFGLDRMVGYNDLRLFRDATGGPDICIAANGKVGIGTTSPDSTLQIVGARGNGTTGTLKLVSGPQAMVLDGNVIDSNYPLWLNYSNANSVILAYGGGKVGVRGQTYTNVGLTVWAKGLEYAFYAEGDLGVNGETWADFYNLNSDARFKTNVQPLPNALDTILNLRGVSFEWKDTKRRKGRQIGFIAQEVEKVLPEIVSTCEDGYKGVGYQNVVPVLVEAMKQQQKQIDELKAVRAENAELKAMLSTVLQRLEQLEKQAVGSR